MHRIVTVTVNPAVDMSTAVEHVAADRKLRCGPVSYEPGGGGINVSRAIRILGGASLALYAAGGCTGEILQTLFRQAGIEERAVPVNGWTRQNLMVAEEASGQQYRFGMPGPELEDREWNRILGEVAALEPFPGFIVGSGGLPPGVPDDFYARLARLGKRRGARVIVDASGEALRQAVSERPFLIKPNMNELRTLAGRDVEHEEDQEAIAAELIRSGRCDVAVISLGAAGVLLSSGGGTERIRAPSVPIQSKVGAGDSMVAGIVLGLSREEPLRDAVLLGIAAGAAAVMTPGSELCRRADVERLYGRLLQRAAGPEAGGRQTIEDKGGSS